MASCSTVFGQRSRCFEGRGSGSLSFPGGLLGERGEQQALVLMLPPAEALEGADTGESSARAIHLTPRQTSQTSTVEARPADASPRTIAYIDSESGVPLVQVGDETHTLH